jgi:protein-L-isoaspartate(D-aspartate) O-methyltransferase
MKSWVIILGTVCLLAIHAFQVDADSFEKARQRMVAVQLEGRDITDPRVLKIMSRVPRHLFVSKALSSQAYADHPLPIGEGQTISQPYIVALMTQILKIKTGEKVLEVGTGSGYQAAVLAELTENVYTIEIRPGLAEEAGKRLGELGYQTIKVKQGDGYFGWPDAAPFDAIIITAAANHIPPPLLAQLKPGGRMILPLGSTTFFQTLTLITKQADETMDVQHLTTVAFVPMIGEVQK